MTSVGEAIDLIELYAGRAGVVGDSLDRGLILKLLNLKLAHIVGDTNMAGSEYTFETDGSSEYDVPGGGIPTKVIADNEVIDPISFSEAEEKVYDGSE